MSMVLALSSSRAGNGGYLESATPLIQDFLGAKPLNIAFIPFASVDNDYEEYGGRVRQALSLLPHHIRVIGESTEKSVLMGAEAIMVGGGNTFKLLNDLYRLDLLPVIQEKVRNNTPYIGWSAGANITGLTIGTTNDMPIIQPQSFSALQLLPLQINPHYLNQKSEGFHGETRDQRLEEFVKLNPSIPVVGLPEGTALRLQDDNLTYLGNIPAVLFQTDGQKAILRQEIHPSQNLSFLLQSPPPPKHLNP